MAFACREDLWVQARVISTENLLGPNPRDAIKVGDTVMVTGPSSLTKGAL